ncbi:MAG: ABC transporter permease [Acidimicrobiales bacterium]
MNRRLGWAAAYAVPTAFFGLFFAWPLLAILGRGLADGNPVGPLLEARIARIAWFTAWQAAVSTALTLVVGLGGAWTLARFRIPGRRLIRALMTVPFVLPTVVVATAFVGVLGRGGPLGSLGLHPSVVAVIAAHVFFNYAVVIRTVGGVFDTLDPRAEDAARVLGATRLQAAREVTLPALRPALLAAASIVFLFTFTSFGVVLILGGPTRATIEVEIWRQTAQLLDLRTAASLSLLQLAAVVGSLVVHRRLQPSTTTAARIAGASEVARPVRTSGERLFVAANLGFACLLLGAPMTLLAVRSVSAPDGFGLLFYRSLTENRRGSVLFVAPAEALTNSLAFAVMTVVGALAIGGIAALLVVHRRGVASAALDSLLMLPLGTSAVTLGFGFLIALDRRPLDLRGSVVLIPIAHTLVAIPFVVRTLVPAMQSVPPRLREAAAVLGASPRRVTWEVDAPVVSRAGLVGAGLAFAVSLGEFGATIFIARPDRPTLPIVIFRLLGQPGALNVGQAMAMSTILMVVTASSVLLIERFRAGAVGSF